MSVKLSPCLRRSTSSGGRSKSLFETPVVRAARFGRRRVATDLVQVRDGDAALDQQADRDVARVGRGQPVGRIAVELARDLLQRREGGHLLGDHDVGAVQDVADAVGQARRLGVDLGLGEGVAVVGHAGGEQVLHVEVGHPQAVARRARDEGRVVDRALVDLRAPRRAAGRSGTPRRRSPAGRRHRSPCRRGRRSRAWSRRACATGWSGRRRGSPRPGRGLHAGRPGRPAATRCGTRAGAWCRAAGRARRTCRCRRIGGADRQAYAHPLERLVVGARAVGQRRLGRRRAGSIVTGAAGRRGRPRNTERRPWRRSP